MEKVCLAASIFMVGKTSRNKKIILKIHNIGYTKPEENSKAA